MSYKKIILPLAGILLIVVGCNQTNSTSTPPKEDFNTMVDSVSYAIGYQNGYQLSNSGFSEVAMQNYLAGFYQGLDLEDSKLKDADLRELFGRFSQEISEKMMSKNLEEGRAFLEENKSNDGIQVTESGLQYKVLTEGNGESPTPSDSVVVRYEGSLISGKVFESTYENDEPAKFLLGRMISGWIEGLQLMKEGSEYMFYVPTELAYGTNPRQGGMIQPNMALIFKIKLIEVR